MWTEKLQGCSLSVDMNAAADTEAIDRLAKGQRGVFSKADLQTLMADPHPASFVRRVNRLIDSGHLRGLSRGWYVAREFDLPTLSQRLAPDSYLSLSTVLARELLIGPRPDRQVTAVKTGVGRTYTGLGCEVVHLHIASHLSFGFQAKDGVRTADAEKAVLDVLYFHLRGRRYPYDIYSDIDYARLDRSRLRSYLVKYRNPRFVSFAAKILELE